MNTKATYLGVILFTLVSFGLQAQGIMKPPTSFSSDLLSTLHPGNDLGISSDLKDKIESENRSYVEDIIQIASGDDDDDTKIKKLTNRKNERDGVLQNAFGNDDLLKSYKKKINKEIKPFKRKYKLAKWVL
ncbi:hypothetical protein [Mangrovimonas sp. YM274]|uniref:hypothetical protein n=1 Tax=Mangrovimonas sp. YM274 TaxID=3070660 RepID=UPI0027DE34BF|nr:hypothetical protein [Mangrovimonas sp. YM274]WMI69365.1 hypothetical protein RBH95_03075 [Mangrovimonas sp. YM274]